MNAKQVRSGFTLVELLVVIAIIGLMVGMMFPAVQASRETARRSQCQTNLVQMALAMQSYQSSFEYFPAGVLNPDGPIRSEPMGLHQGWLVRLLPFLDEQNVYRMIDQSASVYDPKNAAARDYWPRLIICPSEILDIRGASNYAGCHHDVEAPIAADNRGILYLNSRLRPEDVTDGLGYTILLGEKRVDLNDLGWMSGTRATLRNTGATPNNPLPSKPGDAEGQAAQAGGEAPPEYVGFFASHHIGGVFIALADSSVRFVTDEVDSQVWRHLGNRADGNLVELSPAD
jgi:prepilin-type N-terminal cleavage/methylation domain-containing protein